MYISSRRYRVPAGSQQEALQLLKSAILPELTKERKSEFYKILDAGDDTYCVVQGFQDEKAAKEANESAQRHVKRVLSGHVEPLGSVVWKEVAL